MPIAISSDFGPRVHPSTGVPHLHTGIDLPQPRGTPVPAAMAGTVERVDRVGSAKNWRNGNVVFVRGRDGRRWCYLHLATVLVQPGQAVAGRQVLGTVGNTGSTSALSTKSRPPPSSWGTAPNGTWPAVEMPDGSVYWYNRAKGFHLHLQVENGTTPIDPKPLFPTGTFVTR